MQTSHPLSTAYGWYGCRSRKAYFIPLSNNLTNLSNDLFISFQCLPLPTVLYSKAEAAGALTVPTYRDTVDTWIFST